MRTVSVNRIRLSSSKRLSPNRSLNMNTAWRAFSRSSMSNTLKWNLRGTRSAGTRH